MVATSMFGRYELRGIIGDGGFATVYRAWDPLLNREVALKALLPHLARRSEVHERFLAEARSLAPLHHPNIVEFYDVGEAAGSPFFTMELIEGPTIAQYLEQHGALPPDQVAGILRSLGSAIDYLHAAGIVHRDIKAANVMLDPAGRVVLMDFGIARAIDQTQFTRAGAGLGTPETMSPEQVRGLPAGPPADVYALGILSYQLLSGWPPFTGDTAYVLHAQAFEPPPDLRLVRPGLGESTYHAIGRALAKDPAARQPSAGDLVAAVISGLDLLPSAPAPVAPELEFGPTPGAEAGSAQTPNADAATVDSTPVPEPAAVPGRRSRSRLLQWTGAATAVAIAVASLAVIVLATGSQSKAATPPKPAAAAANRSAAAFTGASTPALASATPSTPSPPSPTPSPSPSPTPIPVSVDPLDIAAATIPAWGLGSGSLQVCAPYRNAGTGASLRLNIAAAAAPNTPVASAGPMLVTATPNGRACMNVPGDSPRPAGEYVAMLSDAQHELERSNFVVPEPLAVSNPVFSGASDWGRGLAGLQACADYDHAPSGSGLLLRVVTQADPSTPAVADSAVQPFAATSGNQCVTLPASGARPPNDYIAVLYTDSWQELSRSAFTVAPPPTPVPAPAPVRVAPAAPPPVQPQAPAPAAPPVSAPAPDVAPAPVEQPARIPTQPAPTGPSRIPVQPAQTQAPSRIPVQPRGTPAR